MPGMSYDDVDDLVLLCVLVGIQVYDYGGYTVGIV